MNQPFPFTVHPPPPTDELEPFFVTERRKEHIERLVEKVSILEREKQETARQLAAQDEELAILRNALAPKTPYGFFVKKCYEKHKSKNRNNLQATKISKKCSEKWKTMTQDEKQRFVEMAQKDAERYQAEVAALGGEDATMKRKRGQDSMDPPRRPLSAFLFFSQEKWPEVEQGHPEWLVGQVAEELGRQWEQLTEVEKKKYEEMATKDEMRYSAEMREYKACGGGAGGEKKPGGHGAASTSAEREDDDEQCLL